MSDSPQDRSVGELFGDLSRELSTLVRQELELDSLDFVELVDRLSKRAGFRIEDDDADELRTADLATSFLVRGSAGRS